VCDCSETGWDGTLCQIPVCKIPCENGGKCSGLQICNCEGTGYHGALCTEDNLECQLAVSPCDPLTKCIEEVGSFSCTPCPSGYGGNGKTGCYPVCLDPTCQHGSNCTAPSVCNCNNGQKNRAGTAAWQGPRCTEDVNECDNGGCSTLGNITCINLVGDFECDGVCPANYTGTPYTAEGGCQAICTPPCQQGKCTTPDVCTCTKGYSGLQCQIGSGNQLAWVGWCSMLLANVVVIVATNLLVDTGE